MRSWTQCAPLPRGGRAGPSLHLGSDAAVAPVQSSQGEDGRRLALADACRGKRLAAQAGCGPCPAGGATGGLPPLSTSRLAPAGLATGYFESVHIIPGRQKDTTHFPAIRKDTGVPFERMLFFDDEHGNIARVGLARALERTTAHGR